MLKKFSVDSKEKVDLKDFDPEDTAKLSKKDIKKEYKSLQKRFSDLQDAFYAQKKHGLLIVLQGMDCSGKDGTVRKALKGVNPNGFYVENFKVPTPDESGHDYLWRIHKATPARGDIMVFNRSYYEDVLVTRVHETIDDETAFERFKEIVDFEKYLVSNGTVVLKFFLHISKDFQQEKLEERLERPEKHWKFSASDLAERKHWDEYQACYEDVLAHCGSKQAPWYVVPSNNRWFRDYLILKVIVETLEDLKPEYPLLDGNVKQLIEEIRGLR